MRRPAVTRSAILVASLGFTLVASGAPALAGNATPPDPVTSGVSGRVRLTDTGSSPSVICRFDDSSDPILINGMTIRAPRVRWPNRKPGVSGESGRVAWRITLEHSADGVTGWSTVTTFKRKVLTTMESTAATFADRAIGIS